MNATPAKWTVAFGLDSCVIFSLMAVTSSLAQAAEPVDFDKQIRPIFKERCYSCHGAKKQESGLRLDKRQEAMAGGDTGPAIVPGDTSRGLLLKYVQSEDPELIMPAKGDRLTRKQIDLLKRWIDEGAQWPED
jgi:mono/diheme cytochrome c family protein